MPKGIHQHGNKQFDADSNGIGVSAEGLSLIGQLAIEDEAVASTTDSNYSTENHSDVIVLADTSSSALTVTLSTPDNPQIVIVKDVGGNAGSKAITIDGENNNIDGSATQSISSNYGKLRCYYDGSQWYSI